jgi:serine/threonine-protein kinase HipA
MQEVSIFLFDKHIAQMYQDENRIYLEQIDDLCHKASPLMISKNVKEIETTNLTFLEQVAGFISDSLPGNFGNEILDNYYLQNKETYPSVSDKLIFIGNKGLGALRFEPSIKDDGSMLETLELKSMFEKAKELKKGDTYHSLQNAFLVSAHSFVGGARAKAVAAINLDTQTVFLGDRTKPLKKGFIHAIIKYDDTANDDENKSTYSKLEYVYYLIAKKCGIDISDCFLLETQNKHHFVTKRFDIEEDGKRYHVHSLAGLLHNNYNIPRQLGYEDLFRTAVKLGAQDSLKQLFSQMIFNYMFVNQDDHSRNFSFMTDEDFKWMATPAYDLTFAKGKNQTVEHQLALYGKNLSQINLEDVVKVASEFSIELEFVSSLIENMKTLRDEDLEDLLKQYNIKEQKIKQVLKEVNNRTFRGALVE